MSDQKISREQANQAFNTVVQGISAAMAGKFPIGIDHVELHVEVKAALQTVGSALKEYFGEVTSPKEVTPEAPQQDASEKESD